MNITTENIEEWCFRYLEKDLDEHERSFFEKELKNNTALQEEFSSWERTILKLPASSDAGFNFKKSLFRYKSQFFFLLAEFIIISTTLLVLILLRPIEKTSPKKSITPFIKKTSIIYSSTPATERTTITNNSFQKPFIPVDTSRSITNQFNDQEVKVLHEALQPKDTISSQQDGVESMNTADTSVIQKTNGEKSKKKTARTKRNGSHLVPINNDL